jgi:hypothetical protein
MVFEMLLHEKKLRVGDPMRFLQGGNGWPGRCRKQA